MNNFCGFIAEKVFLKGKVTSRTGKDKQSAQIFFFRQNKACCKLNNPYLLQPKAYFIGELSI